MKLLLFQIKFVTVMGNCPFTVSFEPSYFLSPRLLVLTVRGREEGEEKRSCRGRERLCNFTIPCETNIKLLGQYFCSENISGAVNARSVYE